MSLPATISLALALVLAPTADEGTQNADTGRRNTASVDPGPAEPIEVVVETKKRPDWLFPGLDHPRVQAYFRSGSMVGGSLFDDDREPVRRPLVRAGSIRVEGEMDRSQRNAARKFARKLVADVRPALEACYADALARSPTDATRLTFSVQLHEGSRGPIRVRTGVLGDVYGNACVHGVLEFADVDAPAIVANIDIPVWFWLQTE